MQHRDTAQELFLHRRTARVREFDFAKLITLLAESNARRGERNGDQSQCEVDTRFHW